jgi:death-on-curing family protein
LPKNKATVFRLSAKFIEFLHDELVSQLWPQSNPIVPGEYRDRRLLESAANRPYQSAFGEDAYPDLIEKAGALFHSLVCNHCFSNGNKRTAVLALDSFLLANDHLLGLDDVETYDLARKVASYRQRGKTHEGVLQEIVTLLLPRAIPLALLREAKSPPRFFADLMQDQKYVRRHPLNKQE